MSEVPLKRRLSGSVRTGSRSETEPETGYRGTSLIRNTHPP